NEELLLRTLLPQLSELQHLTLLWAGKEAVKKMLSPEGIPGFLELTLLKISPKTSSTTILTFSKTGKAPLPVVAGILDTSYGIAYCCENNQSSTSL
ncbi:MAG TPA: 4-phosphopantetheinyl transferase family protein, partial [Desulfobacterales bacterium]|nr:4-phosphopantetheinyl transferase family protein [Desulfobacterales bacterium]